jgi:hypothetical protein
MTEKLPEQPGEYTAERTPAHVGNESGGEWLQKHPPVKQDDNDDA